MIPRLTTPAACLLVLLAAVLLIACGGSEDPPPAGVDASSLRSTALGKVVGFESPDGAHVWRGIPFARPPVGDLRWRAPRPAQPWTGTREALAFGNGCMQFDGGFGGGEGDTKGSEDCLYLNVYAPRFAPDAVPQGSDRRPVMVWIHGGGNTVGDAFWYDASLLATQQDVVVVTVHYRLGVFGWFSHPAFRGEGISAEDGSGNYGTLDLVAALQWVKENVAAFGGDPRNVTVFGESAGGTNVFSLLLSPRASGLFHRAIVQSGGAWTVSRTEAENYHDAMEPGDPYSSSETIARLIVKEGKAVDRDDVKAAAAGMAPSEIRSWLRGQPAETILSLFDANGMGGMYRVPELVRDGHVLPEVESGVAFANGDYNRVPVILGTNRDESKLFMLFSSDKITKLFGFPLWVSDEDPYLAAAEYQTKMWKLRGVDDPATSMRRIQGPSVFAYRFDWDDEPDFFFLDVGTALGAAHALEIPFVFGWLTLGAATDIVFGEENAEADRRLSNAMMGYWAQFARTGDPGTGTDGTLPAWTAWSLDPTADKLMVLDSDADQGIRMSSHSLNRDEVLGSIESDARLAEPRDRCDLYYAMLSFTRSIDEATYEKRCPGFPVADHPWKS